MSKKNPSVTFYPWRGGHHVVSKRQNPFNHWRSFISQKNVMPGRINKGKIHPSYLCRSHTFAGQHHTAAAVPLEKRPVPIVQETFWSWGLYRRQGKSHSTGIRSRDHPIRSNTLYQLRYAYRQEELLCFLIPLFRTLFYGNSLNRMNGVTA